MILSAINSMHLERRLVDKLQPLSPMHSDTGVHLMHRRHSSRYRGPIDTPLAMTVGSDVGMDEPHPPNYYHIGSAADPGYYDSMRSAMSGSDLYTGSMGRSRVTDTRPSSSQQTLNNSTSSTLPLTPSVYRRQVKLGSKGPGHIRFEFDWN